MSKAKEIILAGLAGAGITACLLVVVVIVWEYPVLLPILLVTYFAQRI